MKIAVIMTTFNGQKYLKRQIESILLQKFDRKIHSLDLFIRDDGSSDGTVKLIKEIEKSYSNVHLVNNNFENLGVQKSFFYLLSKITAFDFVFFSDQDDVWIQDKVNKFLAVLKKVKNTNIPIGIYSDALLVDSDEKSLNKTMSQQNLWERSIDYHYLSFHYVVTGATFGINRAAIELVQKIPTDWIDSIYMHDAFIALIIENFGELLEVDLNLILYRQHEKNVVGAFRKKEKIPEQLLNLKKRIQIQVCDNYKIFKLLEKFGNNYLNNKRFENEIQYFKYFSILCNSKPFSFQRLKAIHVLSKDLPSKKSIKKLLLFFGRFS